MKTISPHQLHTKLAGGESPLLLDVRERDEYQDWHIPEVLNVPISEFLGARVSLPHDREIITICQHGSRSAQATDYLHSQGFINVITLAGGMVEWNGVYDVVEVDRNILQFRRVGKGCLSYLLISGKKAWVVDPTIDVDIYLKAIKKRRLKINGVLDTHAHADHVSGGRLLAQKEEIKYYAPKEAGNGATDPSSLAFLKVLNTPGHTSGSMCFLFGKILFTGDTLFVESVGRPDLGQDTQVGAHQLYKTLHETILSLAPNTAILPAHTGDHVNVAIGKRVFASMHGLQQRLATIFCLDEKEFVDWIINSDIPKPPNFDIIKQINIGKLALPPLTDIRELEAGPNRCAVI